MQMVAAYTSGLTAQVSWLSLVPIMLKVLKYGPYSGHIGEHSPHL